MIAFMHRSFLLFLLLSLPFTINAQVMEQWYYWFDSDTLPKAGSQITSTSIHFDADVSKLSTGFHTLYVQTLDTAGIYSTPQSRLIYKIPMESSATELRYWFDSDTTPKSTTSVTGNVVQIDADVSSLSVGLHTIFVQLCDDNGTYGVPQSRLIYKVPEASTAKELRYWFDSDNVPRECVQFTGGTVMFDADMSMLTDGYHILYVQMYDKTGTYTAPQSRLVYKIPEVMGLTHLRYCIDGDEENITEVQNFGNQYMIGLPALSPGEHTIACQLFDMNGQLLAVSTATFIKTVKDILIVDSDYILASAIEYAEGFNIVLNSADSHLTIETEEQILAGTIDFAPNASLINNAEMHADSVNVSVEMVPRKWYFLTLPYDFAVANIMAPADAVWALRKYDGEKRAAGNDDGNGSWVSVSKSETLKAGEGFIINCDNGTTESIILTFPAQMTSGNTMFANDDVEIPLHEHNSRYVKDSDWNLVGNPYPSYYGINGVTNDVILTTWTGDGYAAVSTSDDNYVLKPFEAFFVQRPVNTESLLFRAEGRSHGDNPTTSGANMRRAKAVGNRLVYNFTIDDGTYTDRARVVINDDASEEYEVGRDAAKFMSPIKEVPQIFVVHGDDHLAIDERPSSTGHATLGVYSAEESSCTLTVDDNSAVSPTSTIATPIYIIDNLTGKVNNISDTEYTFTLQSGTDLNRFTVIFDGNTNGIEEINSKLSMVNGKCYNLAGQRVDGSAKGIIIRNGRKVVR